MIRFGSEAFRPMGNFTNLAGIRNGRLVAIEPVGVHRGGHVLWRCSCDCGGEKIVQSNNLQRSAGTKSCGCLRKEAAAARRLKDGAWNEGKSYGIANGEHCYKTRHSWAKAAIRHYGNKCERCGWNEARCDVHHRTPKAMGGKHTVSNAVVLCPNCHRVEHAKKGARSCDI